MQNFHTINFYRNDQTWISYFAFLPPRRADPFEITRSRCSGVWISSSSVLGRHAITLKTGATRRYANYYKSETRVV